MNIKMLNIQKDVLALGVTGTNAARLVEVAVAKAFSFYIAAIPPATVLPTELTNYFIEKHHAALVNAVAEINEVYYIDTAVCQDLARRFWLMRSHVVNPTVFIPEVGYDYFCNSLGVPKYFNREDLAFMTENVTTLARLEAYFFDILKDMFDGQ